MPTRNCYPVLIVWAATARAGKSRSYISNIVPARLAESVWCKKKLQSSLYFLLSGFQPSLLLIYFSDSLSGCSHCTKVWRKNLSVLRRSIFEIGDAHLHSGTENLVEITKSGTIFVATQTLSGNVRTYRDGYKKMQKKRKKKRLLCLPIRWIESTCGPYKPLESSLIHRKSERSVLALKIEPFRWVKYSPIFESNLVPLTRANTSVQSATADQGWNGPRVDWNIAFWWGCFGLNFAQMASGGAESDFGLQGWIGPSRLKQIFLIFSVSRL